MKRNFSFRSLGGATVQAHNLKRVQALFPSAEWNGKAYTNELTGDCTRLLTVNKVEDDTETREKLLTLTEDYLKPNFTLEFAP